MKETAANGLGEVIKLTSADALKPSVVHITGPLIRILGDRFGANVKTAVLDTLACLLGKAGVLLKPFFPQLQTTFVKALNDPNRTVRLKAGIALSFLIDIHMRPDPLFNELANGIKNADEASVRDTYLQVQFYFYSITFYVNSNVTSCEMYFLLVVGYCFMICKLSFTQIAMN